ncbi:MAG TPA: hypothetical protein VGF01_05345 [Terracidiphilus sp.]
MSVAVLPVPAAPRRLIAKSCESSSRARQTADSEIECLSKAPASSRLKDALKRLCWSRLCLVFQFMDEGKIGHHHTKGLGAIHPAENLSANSFQLIGDFEGQWKHKSGVDTLKWDVQPLVVVEGNKLRLRGLGFETHDDVFSQGILSPNFEHGKKLVEMALGEFGIDSEPELSALLYGRNDSALRSGCGLLRGRHMISFSIRILQHKYMRLEDHNANDCCKKSSREGSAGGVVGSLHEDASDSSRVDHGKA